MHVHEVVIPIVRLGGALKPIELGQGGTLRRLTDAEKAAWADGLAFQQTWPIHFAEHAVHFVGNATNQALLLHDRGQRIVYDLVSALRMQGTGEPGYRFIYAKISPDPANLHEWHPIMDIPMHGDAMPIDDEAMAKARLLASKFEDVEQVLPSFELARRRFNYSFTRELLGDRFLDWAISLEAALAPDAQGDIGYRVGVRAARLFEADERDLVFEVVRSVYKVRNDVVHRGLHERLADSSALKRLAYLSVAQPGIRPSNSQESAARVARTTVGRVLASLARMVSSAPDFEIGSLDRF